MSCDASDIAQTASLAENPQTFVNFQQKVSSKIPQKVSSMTELSQKYNTSVGDQDSSAHTGPSYDLSTLSSAATSPTYIIIPTGVPHNKVIPFAHDTPISVAYNAPTYLMVLGGDRHAHGRRDYVPTPPFHQIRAN